MIKYYYHKIFFFFLLLYVMGQSSLLANDNISEKLSYKIINYGSIIMNSSSKAIFKYKDKFYLCFQNENRKNICNIIKKK